MNPIRLKAIVRKEFYHLVRDYRSLYLAFAIPLLLIILFGYALSLDVDSVKTVVADYDKTPLSREFVEKLDASPYFDFVAGIDSSGQVADYLDTEKASVAIIVPPGFMKGLKADREAQLQVIIDGSDPVFAGAVRGYVNGFVEAYNSRLIASFLNRQGLAPMNPPVDGRVRVWFNEDLESRNFIIPGMMAIIIMIVGAMLTALVIAREFEGGTMETIKSLPVTAGELLLGKAIPYFFITLINVLVAMLLGQVLFGIALKGSFWLMLAGTSLFLVCALALGLLISTAAKSQLMANQAAVMITYLPSLLLSNFVFPIINMPVVLQWFTYLVPARYYIDLLAGVYLRNTGLDYLWPDMAVLGGMGVLMIVLNFIWLKKEGL